MWIYITDLHVHSEKLKLQAVVRLERLKNALQLAPTETASINTTHIQRKQSMSKPPSTKVVKKTITKNMHMMKVSGSDIDDDTPLNQFKGKVHLYNINNCSYFFFNTM